MRKYTPILLALTLPIWHTCIKLNGSFSLLINLVKHKGIISLGWEMLAFSPSCIIFALLFSLFIFTLASKASIFLSAVILCIFTYLFLPPSFFYQELGIFILVSALIFDPKKETEHLFFSLFFITLLHSFSVLLTSIHFYGLHKPLLICLLPPIISLYFLAKKTIYPSKTKLILLFPLNLFPAAFTLHGNINFTSYTVALFLLLSLSIYLLMKDKSFNTKMHRMSKMQ